MCSGMCYVNKPTKYLFLLFFFTVMTGRCAAAFTVISESESELDSDSVYGDRFAVYYTQPESSESNLDSCWTGPGIPDTCKLERGRHEPDILTWAKGMSAP